MRRFIPYLGVVVALAFSVLFSAIFNNVLALRSAVSGTASTLSVLSIPADFTSLTALSSSSSTDIEDIVITENSIGPTSQKSATTKTVPSVTFVPETHDVAVAGIYSEPLTSSTTEYVSLDASADTLRNALVNIVCYVSSKNSLHSISGSGIIIDPKGIILTNAHIAQYFLLVNHGVSCAIRSGSPAVEKYTAVLMYLPLSWVSANSKVLTEANPIGTGEHDFAFLAISKGVSDNPLPSSFPFIPLASRPSFPGAPVVIASYGAQFLTSNQIQSFLFPTIVFGSIKDIYTFSERTIDIFSLGGSVAAQEGSSGGGVANSKGELIGTITTSTVKGDTSSRTLNAITASYIRADYASDTGKPIDLLLSGSVTDAVALFSSRAKELRTILDATLAN